MQHFLKAFAGAARAWIIPTQLFEKLLVAMDDPNTALDVRFGWIASTAFTDALESRVDRSRCYAWDTSRKIYR